MNMKRVIVFGATGNLGAYISLHLKEEDYDVIAVGCRKNDNGLVIPDKASRHFLLTGDRAIYTIAKNAAVDLMEHYLVEYELKDEDLEDEDFAPARGRVN